MDGPDETNDPYASGFAISRREVLRTGAAVGITGALAGCPADLGTGTDAPTEASTSTPAETAGTPTGTPGEEPTTASGTDGLTVVATDIVRSSERGRHLRVVLRNDTADEAMSMVSLSAEFFDPDLAFLGIQTATVSYFQPGERFEGYVPVVHDEAAAYAVEATRTGRREQRESLKGITVEGDCLDDEQVHGTVTNDGPSDVGRVGVRASFFDGNGRRLGSGLDTVTGLEPGASVDFEVDLENVLGDPSTAVSDYAVAVGDYGNARLSVR